MQNQLSAGNTVVAPTKNAKASVALVIKTSINRGIRDQVTRGIQFCEDVFPLEKNVSIHFEKLPFREKMFSVKNTKQIHKNNLQKLCQNSKKFSPYKI